MLLWGEYNLATVSAWAESVVLWIAGLPEDRACAVVFPVYRPDLVRALARKSGGGLLDFREAIMAPLGWKAAELGVEALDDAILPAMAAKGSLVLQNAEALLSLAPAAQRQRWFEAAFARTWPARLILPLTLYAGDLPGAAANRVHTVQPSELPEESLLGRLAQLS